ncbi:MAG: SH3 domain-containing protein, partial [Lachnospiraceae bacterium]|nr:SH3 domain-containing protein [Lachnospiraceae bacterium]
MTFRKFFLIISIIVCVFVQTACGNSAAEEAVAVEQEGDSTQEAEETEEQVNSLSSEEETTEATVSKKETEKAETQETTDTKKETETKEIMSVGDHNSTDDNINSSEDNQNPAEDNDTEEENGPQIDRQDIQPYDTPATLYAQQKVNIRKGPSTDFDVLGMLNLNDAVSVVGESKSSPWKEIQY